MSSPLIESLESRQLLSAGHVPWASPLAPAVSSSSSSSSATTAAPATSTYAPLLKQQSKRSRKPVLGGTGDPATTALSAGQVQQILAAAGSQALPTQVIAVVDREGSLLGLYGGSQINPSNISIVSDFTQESIDTGIAIRAIQRARTAAFFQSQGEAFTTRTARFIIENHFPQPIRNTAGGPLYGVEFSSLPTSDIILPQIATGISGDPGGVPLYINGIPVGGIGVAGDFHDVAPTEALKNEDPLVGTDAYGQQAVQTSFDTGKRSGKEDPDTDEAVALAGSSTFQAPPRIRANQIVVGGLRFPYTASRPASAQPAQTLAQLTSSGHGNVLSLPNLGLPTATTLNGQPERAPDTVAGVPGLFRITNNAGHVDPVTGIADTSNPHLDPQDSDPVISSNDIDPTTGQVYADSERLTSQDVLQAMSDAVKTAKITRAGIRKPNGLNAVVHVAVVDRDGTVLGVFRMQDGTNFSYDIAVQKARTAAFFSDNTHAFSARAIGFLSQKFFPPGQDTVGSGPLFTLQDALSLQGKDGTFTNQKNNARLRDGITVFPGGEPLYKNGVLVGAIGVSGDGVDQDDMISFGGTKHFRPPDRTRSDQLGATDAASWIVDRVAAIQADPNLSLSNDFVTQAKERISRLIKHVQLPYVKFPRNPKV